MRSWLAHTNSQFLSHTTHSMRLLSDLTVISWLAHTNSKFYHTRLTVWDHYLISLWDHGELTVRSQFLSHMTHSMRSISDFTVRSWSAHMNSQFYHTRLTVWDHYLISLGPFEWLFSLLTFFLRQMSKVKDHSTKIWRWILHDLFSLWDHGQLTWTHTFITLGSTYEIIIWSYCEIMVSSHELTLLTH